MRVSRVRFEVSWRKFFVFAVFLSLFCFFAEPATANTLPPVMRPFFFGANAVVKGNWAEYGVWNSENAPLFFKDEEDNEYYLQLFFKPLNSINSNIQWLGDVRSFKKPKDAKRFQEKWSANQKLNLRTGLPLEARTVYTPSVHSPNAGLDLTGAAFPKFQNLVRFNDSDNFLRRMGFAIDAAGTGAADRTKGQEFVRWLVGNSRNDKLFDIYHSGIALVGPPMAEVPEMYRTQYEAFKTTHANRSWVVYVQSNAGMLHAFDKETGAEKWAFIPPNVMENARLRGLKANVTEGGGNQKGTYFYADVAEGLVVPRFLANGPVVVEDVWTGSSFITLLLGSLGFGGRGMYALDVTNSDDPIFLWAVENVAYAPTPVTLLWSRDSTNPSRVNREEKARNDTKWNYEELNFPVSTPFIGTLLPGGRWVALAGNGSVYPFEQGKGVVFVFDVLNGEILNKLPAASPYPKNLASPMLVMRETEGRRIRTFFVADTNNAILRGVYNEASGTWSFSEIVKLQGTDALSYALDIADDKDGNRYLFVATGDRDGFVAGSTNSYLYIIPIDSAGNTLVNNPQAVLTLGEYRLASPPVVYNGFAFFSTYNRTAQKSRIYSIHITDRTRYFWRNLTQYYIEFSKMRVTGVALAGGKLAFSVVDFDSSEYSKYFSEPLFKKDDSGEILFTHIEGNPNMLYVELFNAGFDPGGGDFDLKADMPLFWKAR